VRLRERDTHRRPSRARAQWLANRPGEPVGRAWPRTLAPRAHPGLLPSESGRWSALEARIHLLAERFGYGEIRTPVFESTDLFVRGVGSQTDIVEKEMYSFDDRSGRSLTLRPEWTAPVVRAALEHRLFDLGRCGSTTSDRSFATSARRGAATGNRTSSAWSVWVAGPEADLEVISLAWELVRDMGSTTPCSTSTRSATTAGRPALSRRAGRALCAASGRDEPRVAFANRTQPAASARIVKTRRRCLRAERTGL